MDLIAKRLNEQAVKNFRPVNSAPSQAAVSLYDVNVMHRRHVAPLYRFVYKLFYVLFDIDQIGAFAEKRKFFSFNRWNLLSFRTSDFVKTGTLRDYVESALTPRGIARQNIGRIRIFCLPRVLGFAFNPISLFYVDDTNGNPIAVIAFVRNTFGEQHSYVLGATGAELPWSQAHSKTKNFHVSPFFDLVGEYQFTFTNPGERIRVVINEFRDDKPLIDATVAGARVEMTDSAILKRVLLMPFSTLKVVAGIHWEALKIWLRGAKFHKKPAAPTKDFS